MMRTDCIAVACAVGLMLVADVCAADEGPLSFTDDCSSVALDNDGQNILGGNLDLSQDVDGMLYILKRGRVKTGLAAGTTGAVAEWTAKYGSVAFSLVGYQHAWAGMNERGLVFSTMRLESTVNPPPDERPPLSMMWPQYILDTCETVQEVVASDDLVRIRTVDHFLFADRYGGVAVIEFLEGEMVAHTGPELCAFVLTNTEYEYACYMWRNMRPSGDCSHWDNSIQRFCLGAFLLEDFQAGSTSQAVDYAFTTLREMYPPGYGWVTRWSIVFDTADLRAYFKTQREPDVRWVDLDDFDLRCGKPPMMLGINEVTSGDAGDAFSAYDSDRNRAFRRAYYDQWVMAWDAEEMRLLLEHLESFPCSQTRMSGPRRLKPSRP